MTVRVQFFSHLKDIAGNAEPTVEVLEGAKVSELLAKLYSRYPGLRAWDGTILVGAGLEFVDRDYVLQSGDQIAIMPPVQGG